MLLTLQLSTLLWHCDALLMDSCKNVMQWLMQCSFHLTLCWKTSWPWKQQKVLHCRTFWQRSITTFIEVSHCSYWWNLLFFVQFSIKIQLLRDVKQILLHQLTDRLCYSFVNTATVKSASLNFCSTVLELLEVMLVLLWRLLEQFLCPERLEHHPTSKNWTKV